jgi:hypothetical protein
MFDILILNDKFFLTHNDIQLGLFTRDEVEALADTINECLEEEDAYDGPEQETPIEQMYAYAGPTTIYGKFDVPLENKVLKLTDGIDNWYFKAL